MIEIPENITRANALTDVLCGELFSALGFSNQGLISRAFSPLVRKPIQRFSKIAVGFDEQVKINGFQQASHWILPNFVKGMTVLSNPIIPKIGPLIIASNHPGAFDALVITANVPRDDVKIIVNIPLNFIKELPITKTHFLYAPEDPHIRIKVVRDAIRHLEHGGALLLFASGGIDPDPACMPNAAEDIGNWSRSLEIFLRRVPQTQILITMVSGILALKFVKHPLTVFRKARRDKQRISEFFQVIYQMLYPGKLLQIPAISFAEPLKFESRMETTTLGVMQALVQDAMYLFQEHIRVVL